MVSTFVFVKDDAAAIGVVEGFDAGGDFVMLHVQIIHRSTSGRVIHFAAAY